MLNQSKEKKLIKKLLPRNLISCFRKLVYPERLHLIEANLNSLFLAHYQKMNSPDLDQKIALRNAEFKVYSKLGEDGMILHIFSKIGVTNRRFVEFGIQDGQECNTANLSLNFGWQGILVDAKKEFVESAKSYYRHKLGKDCRVKPVHCFVTAENINKLLLDNGVEGEIDLLSIDIDGNDYWVWRAIQVIHPRLVIMEYNASFGLKPITIKYNQGFYYRKTFRENPLYFGASLTALKKLANSKGYILVGCDSNGHDAFFVRKDVVAESKFIELPPEEAFYPNPHTIQTIGSLDRQFDQIKHLDFDYV